MRTTFEWQRDSYRSINTKLDHTYNRDEVLDFLNEQGVMSRPIWTPLHLLTPYSNMPTANLSITDDLNSLIINIPSTPLREV